MRLIRRTKAIVPSFMTGGNCLKQAQQNETARLANSTIKLSFPEHWNLPDVRGALYAMHGDCCVYCNSPLLRNDRGDVEHFRPKGAIKEDAAHGGYWWLAYSFENYLLGCSLCNRTFKKTHFPLKPGGRRTTYGRRRNILAEPRLLIDPTLDPVENWITVDWRHILCPIKVKEKLDQNYKIQVEYMLKLFKINTEPLLVRARVKVRDKVKKAISESNFSYASSLAIRYRPHSLTAKQMLAEDAPQHLPTVDTEILWLLNELIGKLWYTLELLKNNLTDERLQRLHKELLWSLAVLWRDPPEGATINIEDFLTNNGIDDFVRKYFNQLSIIV